MCGQVATLFGVSPEDISIVEFNHATDNLLKSFQFQSGFLVLIDRLGELLNLSASTGSIISTCLKMSENIES